MNKPVKLEGTVVKMDWVNPHTWLYLDVKRPDGTVEHWQVEGGAPGVLLRNGWTKNTLAEGTKIIVNGHQAKDGAFRANSSNIEFPDGRKLDTGSSYNDKRREISGGQSPDYMRGFTLNLGDGREEHDMRKLLLPAAAWPSCRWPAFSQTPQGWNDPFPPHKIMDNMYYVGTKELASFLFVTPAGNILMNSDYESSVPVIKASVEKLGFKFSDIKILIAGHAHPDHVGGDNMVKELTGAQVVVGRVDAAKDQGFSPGREGAPDRPAGRRGRHGHARRNNPDRPPDARSHKGMPRLEHELLRKTARRTTRLSSAA